MGVEKPGTEGAR